MTRDMDTLRRLLDRHLRWGHPATLTALVVREGTIATLRCVPCGIVYVEVRAA